MMKPVLSLMILVLVLSLVASANKVLLYDDFTENTGLWQSAGGNWAVKDGSLVHSPSGSGAVVMGDPSWTDYTIEVRYTMDEYLQHGHFRVFWRSNKDYEGYGLNIANGYAYVRNYAGAWDKYKDMTGLNYNVKVPVGQETHLKIVVSDNKFAIYVNGQLVWDLVDEEDEWFYGPIRMRFSSAAGRVHEIKVYE